MPEPVSVHDFPEIRWRGHWIWVPEESIDVRGWVPTKDGIPQPEMSQRGSVPSPHGVVTVEASRAHLTIDSPVPIVLDLPDQPERRLTAGHHELTSETLTNVDARLSVAPAR
jgi:hypothetical protein